MRTIDVGLGEVTHLAFSPDGRLLAATGEEGAGLALWPALAGGRGPFDRLPIHEPLAHVAWHPDGYLFATASPDSTTVQVWDTRRRQRREFVGLPGQEGPMFAVAFSPDGGRLAFGGGWRDEPARAIVVPTAKWRPSETIGDHAKEIVALLFTRPDVLLTASYDRTVAVHGLDDPADDGPPVSLPSRPAALALGPDGSRLAVAAGSLIHLWRVDAAGRPVPDSGLACRGHKGVAKAVAFSPDGRALASAGEDGSLRFWDADTGASRAALDVGLGVLKAVAYAPDGLTVVAAGAAGTAVVVDAE